MKIIKKKKKRIEYSKTSKYFEKRVGLRISVGMEPQSNSRMREEKKIGRKRGQETVRVSPLSTGLGLLKHVPRFDSRFKIFW